MSSPLGNLSQNQQNSFDVAPAKGENESLDRYNQGPSHRRARSAFGNSSLNSSKNHPNFNHFLINHQTIKLDELRDKYQKLEKEHQQFKTQSELDVFQKQERILELEQQLRDAHRKSVIQELENSQQMLTEKQVEVKSEQYTSGAHKESYQI